MNQPHDAPDRFAPCIRRESLPLHKLDEDQFDRAFGRWLVYSLTLLIVFVLACIWAAARWMEISRG